MTTPDPGTPENRTSPLPLLIAGVIFVAIVAIWLPYLQEGAFQDGVVRPGLNTTEDSDDPVIRRGGPQPEQTPDPEATRDLPADPEPEESERRSVFSGKALRATILDQDTREPLPFYLVEATQSSRGHRSLPAFSNAEGQAEWASLTQRGEVHFRLEDLADLPRQNSLAPRRFYFDPEGPPESGRTVDNWGAGPFVLEAETGPTVWLRFEPPEGYRSSDFTAKLLATQPYPGNHSLSNRYASPVRSPRKPLLHPDLPWVRFHIQPNFRDLGWVVLTSKDQAWTGGAWLQGVRGQRPEPVEITLQRTTNASGTMAYDTTEECDWVELYLLQRSDLDPSIQPRRYESYADESGEFQFRDVRPGEYWLGTQQRHWYPFQVPVVIRPGENSLGNHALRARRVKGSISGVITTTSGLYDGACHISLSNTPGEHGAPYDHTLDWEDDGSGRLSAQFEFEDVTEGEWFLYLHCHDAFDWSQQVQTVSAPASNLHIELEHQTLDLRIEAHDPETGESLGESAQMDWWVNEERDSESGAPFHLKGLQRPLNGFGFRIYAPGYQPVQGDAFDLAELGPGKVEGDVLSTSIPLTPGWGCLFEARHRTHATPIPKVAIYADGDFAGHTDENGQLLIAYPEPPKTLRVEKDGWQWISTPGIQAPTGKFTLPDPFDGHMFLALERLGN